MIENMKDVGYEADGKRNDVFVTISVRQLEEIGDYSEGDDISMTIKGKVVKTDMPQVALPPVVDPANPQAPPPVAPDYNKNPELLKPDTKVTFQILTAEVLNKKPTRKRSEELDMSKTDLEDIQNKRSNA